jgi:hypothetical protein
MTTSDCIQDGEAARASKRYEGTKGIKLSIWEGRRVEARSSILYGVSGTRVA